MQHQFLSRILPILPPPGMFGERSCYFALNLKENGETIRDQKPFNDLKSICSFANNGSANGFNSYMALASFKSSLNGRKQVNAQACRCIWADIDAGKYNADGTLKGKYANQVEAARGLTEFVNATGLKPSIVVSSGAGLHIYWSFDRNIEASIWVQMADLFLQLCRQEGLDVDPSRAKDLASVLRLPGTIHQKSGKTVQLMVDSNENYTPLDFMKRVTSQLRAPTAVAAPVHITRIQQPMNDPLADLLGMGPQPPTANAARIAQNCRQIATMGVGPYPQWFAAMSVFKRCVNGLEWAKAFSQTDMSRYNEIDCENKFFNASEDAPAKCITFEIANPSGCVNCRHRGNIKSPAQLTHISEPPKVEQPVNTPAPVTPIDTFESVLVGQEPQLVMPGKGKWAMPYIPMQSQQYKVDERGTIWNQATQDASKNWTTTEHVITSIQLWFKYSAHRCENGQHHTIHYFDAIFPNKNIRELRIIAGEDMTEHNIMKTLHSADITPKGTAFNGKVFMGFFNAYLDSVMNIKKIVPIVKEFGWTKFDDPISKQNVPGFVVGSGVITETGIHPVGHDPGTTGIYAGRAFDHAGSMENWKHIPQMYTTLKQQFSIFAMCCSLASPFMKYGIAEAKNSYVNLYSPEGGKGKSTLLRAAHSIWGNPAFAFGSPNASISQRGKAMSVWNNLPYFVDEVTRMKNEDMNNMVYVLAGGMDKDRLKSNADLTMTGQWSMFTMSTANRSVKEALAKHAGDTDATLLRVTEYECDFPNYDGMPDVQRYIRAVCDIMENNYGIAGPEFMYHIMRHPERLLTLRSLVDNWRISNKFKDSERFLAFSVGIPLHIGRWAVEWGIFDFDMDELERWILRVLVPFNREHTAELSPDFVNNMTVYLNSRLPSMLQVRRDKRNTDESDGMRPGLYDKYIIRYPQYNELSSRYEQENNTLYIATSDFKRWCDNIGISPATMVKNLAYHGILLENGRVNLGAQVSWLPTSRMRCYIIKGESLDKLGWKPSAVSQIAPIPQETSNGFDFNTLNNSATVCSSVPN